MAGLREGWGEESEKRGESCREEAQLHKNLPIRYIYIQRMVLKRALSWVVNQVMQAL